MSSRSAVAVALGVLLVPCAAVAQEGQMVLATYFQCDIGREGRTDELASQVFAPVYDQMVEAGAISGWGWMAHQVGGKVRRLGYMVAADQGALLEAQGQLIGTIQERHPEAGQEFSSICPAHEDYIWSIESIAQMPSEAPGTQAQVSTYYYCDISREGRSDELVSETFGPVFDRLVSEGKLASWGWLSHDTGGKWRRLMTMSAPDFKALYAARTELLEAVQAEAPEAGTEFSQICSAHEDYLWNVVVAR